MTIVMKYSGYKSHGRSRQSAVEMPKRSKKPVIVKEKRANLRKSPNPQIARKSFLTLI